MTFRSNAKYDGYFSVFDDDILPQKAIPPAVVSHGQSLVKKCPWECKRKGTVGSAEDIYGAITFEKMILGHEQSEVLSSLTSEMNSSGTSRGFDVLALIEKRRAKKNSHVEDEVKDEGYATTSTMDGKYAYKFSSW